ncbi:MAG: Tetratricopeptide repeat protein [Candidatus Moranbacteria bacterium GW2011_GWE1_36_7]|nr:MAG: Tetratricopeptide repeat protein [Candidatus Moranbacteria bacterium GW2011_GWD2_36_12]KKQ07189.1 MAG: Tetratricopeptide repeat protein [Candidatus Moranbacteria bacterium GW2011_GWE2_36_40]KKQ15247.1 MAG: Tetratricopeptide repeat protein [Candidatus Moranbacteria bacterium GW2011_GWE1_36_7]
MDTNNSYQSNNNILARQNTGGNFGYDLQSEKEEVEKITLEVKNDLLKKWKKVYANAQIFPAQIAAMHPEGRDFLLSFDLVGVYDDIAQQAGLDVNGRNVLPQIVWQIAIEKKWNELDSILELQLPLVHSVHVKVADLLMGNILNKVLTLSEKPLVRKVVDENFSQKKQTQLSLSAALAQYPRLAEQGVTSNQLKMRYSAELARPSIKNWIKDYQDNFGAVKHSPIDRGNFLFHSENGKRLSSFDRQKLATILKSLDDQALLMVDAETQTIIFDGMQGEQRVKREQGDRMGSQPMRGVGREQGDRMGMQSVMQNEQRVKRDRMGMQSMRGVGREQGDRMGMQAVMQNEQREERDRIGMQPMQGARREQIDRAEMQPVQRREIGKFETQQPQRDVRSEIDLRREDVEQNGLNRNSFVVSERTENFDKKNQQKERQETFFSVPNSKPPIGSDEYQVEKIDNKNVVPNSQHLAFGKEPIDQAELMTGQKIESNNNAFVSPNNISFSSPQKLSAEQTVQSKSLFSDQSENIYDPLAQQSAQKNLARSLYHIAPSKHAEENNESEFKNENAGPKISGNVVDLRN